MKDNHKLFYLFVFVLALAVNFAGINVKFFTDDPGLYAAISKNLIYRKEFFELFSYNRDWLDKPHFPFWAAFLSFKAFGLSVWAYRLPALLFFVLSLVYTYLFTRKYYGWETAAMAVLIVMTAQNTILSNTDVRAEPYLMALITGSIYHIARLEERFSIRHLLLAALLTAFAIMTKGIFVITAIYGALIGQLFFQGKLKTLFQLKWLWLLALTFVFILPELYALYIQFDLHPEKMVFNTHHVSGIKWFLWDSQFGRFVNSGPINRKSGGGSIIFYLHTLLWAFAPWCLLFYYAVFKSLRAIFQKKKLAQYYALSGGLLLLLLFSVSGFQLPFYTNALFPLFAIVTAPVCFEQLSKFGTKLRLIVEWVFVILLPAVIVFVNVFLKPANTLFFILDIVGFAVLVVLIFIKITAAHKRAFFLTCASALFAGFYINTVFYGEVIPYKGQIAAAAYVNQTSFDTCHLYAVSPENNVFQFYCNSQLDIIPVEQFDSFKSNLTPVVYINQHAMDKLIQTHAHFKIIHSFIDYPREDVLPDFINKATRYKVLDSVYLVTR